MNHHVYISGIIIYLVVPVFQVSYLSNVRVGFLRIDAPVIFHVTEGVGHVASSAAVVLLHTVHEVLWAEVHELARLLGQLALESPGRTEGPAGAAGTL